MQTNRQKNQRLDLIVVYDNPKPNRGLVLMTLPRGSSTHLIELSNLIPGETRATASSAVSDLEADEGTPLVAPEYSAATMAPHTSGSLFMFASDDECEYGAGWSRFRADMTTKLVLRSKANLVPDCIRWPSKPTCYRACQLPVAHVPDKAW